MKQIIYNTKIILQIVICEGQIRQLKGLIPTNLFYIFAT